MTGFVAVLWEVKVTWGLDKVGGVPYVAGIIFDELFCVFINEVANQFSGGAISAYNWAARHFARNYAFVSFRQEVEPTGFGVLG